MVLNDSNHQTLERTVHRKNALPLSKHKSNLEVIKVRKDFVNPRLLFVLYGSINCLYTNIFKPSSSCIHFNGVCLFDVESQESS